MAANLELTDRTPAFFRSWPLELAHGIPLTHGGRRGARQEHGKKGRHMEESPRLSAPGFSRRGLLKSSLIVGLGAAGLSAASTAVTAGVARASENAIVEYKPAYDNSYYAIGVQTQWAYCDQCRNIWYNGESINSFPCVELEVNANGGLHVAGSTDYAIAIDNSPGFTTGLQSPWYWCSYCGCLYYGPDGSGSWCIAGGGGLGNQVPHNGTSSGVYYMPYNADGGWLADDGATMQPGWKYCDLCKCLYWGDAQAESYCQWQFQEGGGTNHATGSSIYYMAMMTG